MRQCIVALSLVVLVSGCAVAPTHDSQVATSLAAAGQGNVNEAINHFQEALRINPEFAEAHAALARALTMQGKRSEAIDHYEEALRLLRSKKKIASKR